MKRLIAFTLAVLLMATATGCQSDDNCEIPITTSATEDSCETTHTDQDSLTVPPAKPVIYLYPETQQQVTVKLDLEGELTCTYPAYQNGWTVTADPDGTLTDNKGLQYNYLYWEGITENRFDFSQGWCIKGEHTAAFLEYALEKLGLNRREANEFIVYWLPQMEQNPYNLICFQQEAYTELARLDITPEPDTLIRVFMTWQASDVYINLPEQVLTAQERTGFTAVEWGGARLPDFHGCDTDTPQYTVTIAPSQYTAYLVNELKDTYAAGEEVTIQLATITEHYYILTVNGEPQSMDMASSDLMYTYFRFTMPSEDVRIEIRMKAADLPVWSENT